MLPNVVLQIPNIDLDTIMPLLDRRWTENLGGPELSIRRVPFPIREPERQGQLSFSDPGCPGTFDTGIGKP